MSGAGATIRSSSSPGFAIGNFSASRPILGSCRPVTVPLVGLGVDPELGHSAGEPWQELAADDLLAAAPWLDCGPHEETIRRSHDAFDAVIAALTARAASRGQTCPPGDDDLAAAATEGWIAIPHSPISQLL